MTHAHSRGRDPSHPNKGHHAVAMQADHAGRNQIGVGLSITETATVPVLDVIECIVVTFDSAAAIVECLDALRQFTAARITVVDNGSIDGTVGLARLRADKIIEMGANCGYAAALNCAVGEASGDYIFVVNPDLRLLTEIGELVALLQQNKRRVD